MTEHVPNPNPWEDWTEEDEIKFKMFSDHCPMCSYKYKYAVLQRLVQAVNDTQDQNIVIAMQPQVTAKSQELIELGLVIATMVDNSNKAAGMAGHN